MERTQKVVNTQITFEAFLVQSQILSEHDTERAIRLADQSNEELQSVVTHLGLITEKQLTEAMANYLGLEIADTQDFPTEPILQERLSPTFLRDAKIIPLREEADQFIAAFANPFDNYAAEALRFAAHKPIHCKIAAPSDFDRHFERLYGANLLEQSQASSEDAHDAPDDDDFDRLRDMASEAPVIRLVSGLILSAVEARASDIHIEPMDGELKVRFRIDGVLQEIASPPARLASAIISRVKIMAKLNIAERRLPQDGRIRHAVRGNSIDFRVSTTPTIHGESVVLRILDKGGVDLSFVGLGFDDELILQCNQILARPHGIFLVTGPTGSGKTTTLYAALRMLNSAEKKILTIEDPVEYQLKGINQVQVKREIGHSFANALRSFLRQDPDIMMIGEIRDLETAQIAVQAALTGHLILSTLHTNDAASAVTRLLDMGVEDYLLPSTINGIIAQRLVRQLCPECRSPYQLTPELASRIGVRVDRFEKALVIYRARGCNACNETGYAGRTSIVEVLAVTDSIRDLILHRASSRAIEDCAIQGGMRTMYQHGMSKVLLGITSIEEVSRVTRMI